MRDVRPVLRKATFNLSAEVLTALDRAVAAGAAPSKSAFVQRALGRELNELERAERRAQWAEASRDPAFIRAIETVEAAFRSADGETARSMG